MKQHKELTTPSGPRNWFNSQDDWHFVTHNFSNQQSQQKKTGMSTQRGVKWMVYDVKKCDQYERQRLPPTKTTQCTNSNETKPSSPTSIPTHFVQFQFHQQVGKSKTSTTTSSSAIQKQRKMKRSSNTSNNTSFITTCVTLQPTTTILTTKQHVSSTAVVDEFATADVAPKRAPRTSMLSIKELLN